MAEKKNDPAVTQKELTVDERRSQKFDTLFKLNVNEHKEKKNGLDYLTWSWAWAEFKKIYPSATFEVVKDPSTNLPYFSDENVGIMCYTRVTADDLTYEMWLAVMDAANNAMKKEAYSIQTKYGSKTVQAATMTDINKTIMRCLVKNLAMFGLGLYIYAGEDLPEDISDSDQKTKQQSNEVKQPVQRVVQQVQRVASPQSISQFCLTLDKLQNDPYASLKDILVNLKTVDDLMLEYTKRKVEVESNPEMKNLFGLRKRQISA